jgi:drug/metabolite transporter (DMT)-like permease
MALTVQMFVFVLIISAGQILFKMAANSFDRENNILRVLLVPEVWVAFVLYGLATLLWIYILNKHELSKAYPFVSLTFVIVPLLSVIFLKEKLDMYYFIGIGCILLGLFFINKPNLVN